MNTKGILWLGFGDIAARCLPRLPADCVVSAVTRRERSLVAPHRNLCADASDAGALREALAEGPEIIVLTLTPGERSPEAYRARYLAVVETLLTELQQTQPAPRRIFFVSSTSVYGQSAGEWVTEASPAEPSSDTAKVLRECEARLWQAEVPVTVIRFSGIYGPGRWHLLKQVVAGRAGNAAWTNRIHSEDCAGVIAWLIKAVFAERPLPSLLLASDAQPVRAHDVRQWLANAMHCRLSPSEQSDGVTLGRRCDSSQLRALGYSFQYPGYREGFAELIPQFLAQQRQQQQ